MKIPASIRMTRLWTDIKRRMPFLKHTVITPEGQALLIHLRNLYHGDAAYSDFAREFVDHIMENLNLEEKEAVESIYLFFYGKGLIDELDLLQLKV